MSDLHRDPVLGAKVDCVGWWPQVSKASVLWRDGTIVGVGAGHTKIKTDTDIELSVMPRRIHWRPKHETFACFSMEVDEQVQQIERHERQADLMMGGPGTPLRLGDFVRCFLSTTRADGFVIRRVSNGYLVSLPHDRRWIAYDACLKFDRNLNMWIARGVAGGRDTIDA